MTKPIRNPQTYQLPPKAYSDYVARLNETSWLKTEPKKQWTWTHVLLVYVFLAYYLYQTWSILGEVFNV